MAKADKADQPSPVSAIWSPATSKPTQLRSGLSNDDCGSKGKHPGSATFGHDNW